MSDDATLTDGGQQKALRTVDDMTKDEFPKIQLTESGKRYCRDCHSWFNSVHLHLVLRHRIWVGQRLYWKDGRSVEGTDV